MLSLWFVWFLLAGVSLFFAGKSMIRWISTSTAEEAESAIDRMGSETFTAYIARLFADLSYGVQIVQDGHDYGADLILEREGTRIIVHARRQSEYVGVVAVQQVVAAKAMYSCSVAMVVTNNLYTHSALHLAEVNGVMLWDRQILLSEIAQWRARRRYDKVRTRALYRRRSRSTGLLAGALLSVGLVGFWPQGFSWLKPQQSPQPVIESQLPQPAAPGLRGFAPALESTATVVPEASPSSGASPTEKALEDVCGTAIVQGVAALAIREGPSRQYAVVGEVPQGRSIKLVCEPTVSADGVTWQLVDYGAGQGWMSRKYLLSEQR
ncbi:MAG TPA: restriction endonuclease [Herpetosiphonaceae bacterium]